MGVDPNPGSRKGGGSSGPGGPVRRRAADGVAEKLAVRFGEALRRGEPKAAERLVDEALESGLDVAAVHTQLIEPAMRWIGELWEIDAISVSAEHLATAISHQVAARLFARALRGSPGSGERVMMAGVQGEHHALGLRLAADVLEGAGYEVLYLGADVPLPALLDACRDHQPDVLGLTVSMWLNVPTMLWEIAEVTQLENAPKVMVGGRAVVQAAAHGLTAPTVEHADQVLSVVDHLIASPRNSGVISADLASRVPLCSPTSAVGATEFGTIPAAFAATSVAAADSVRESARRAFAMEDLAYRDGLTGLFNRRAYDDRFMAMAEQPDLSGTLLMIDVDKFKSINDTYGHEAGDAALVAVGDAILGHMRPGDFAARFGGDEFVVLLPATSSSEAVTIAERIRTAIADSPTGPPMTISVGLGDLSSDHRLTSQSADRALYLAKASGRNNVARAEA